VRKQEREKGREKMKIKTLREVAIEANNILTAWDEAADMDATFDGGEFSGPAADRAAEREITALAEANGFTYEQVENELIAWSHEQPTEPPYDVEVRS
jgi:hypothetical protein